jgi:hypothetical protein
MILDAACEHFSRTSKWQMSQYLPDIIAMETLEACNELEFWQRLFKQHHDIWQDHRALTGSRELNDMDFARHFESLRRVYPQRFEYQRYRLPVTGNKKAAAIARRLLFQ